MKVFFFVTSGLALGTRLRFLSPFSIKRNTRGSIYFTLYILILFLTLLLAVRIRLLLTNWSIEDLVMKCFYFVAFVVSSTDRLDFRRSLVSGLPSPSSGEQRGLLSRTAAGNRAYSTDQVTKKK